LAGTVLAGQKLTSALVGCPPWIPMAGSYTNSWSDYGSGNSVGQYRLWPLINEVEIIGTIQHASISGSSAFFTLGSGYQPQTAQVVGVYGTNSSNYVSIQCATTGVLSFFNLSSNTFIQFHGWISLDA
jgi:hypothetical protein